MTDAMRRARLSRLTLATAAFGLAIMRVAAQAGEPEAPHLGACGPVAGAFRLPGSDACLRLSGFVAADVGAWRASSIAPVLASPAARATGDLGRSAIGADARVSADVRLPTDLGPARVFVSLRARHGGLPAAR